MKSLLVSLIVLLASVIPLSAADPAKPNILLIVADDMGFADCGVNGCKDIPTPALDALAAESIRFTDGYVTGAVCSPTRCALMTGRYQQRDGVHDWVRPGGKDGMDPAVPTIAEYLKKAGYQTALIGKWHLGEKPPYQPLNRGFDYFYGFLGGGRNYYPYSAGKGNSPYVELRENGKPVKQPDYTTFAFGRKSVEFITRRKPGDKPFFLVLSFNAVHAPMQPPKNHRNAFDTIPDKGRRAYAGMLAAMDDSIASVLKAIVGAGLEENTLICFISDNGGPINRNAPNHSCNDPLRGGKGETWEGGIRVPFFVKWKGRLEAGGKFKRPVTQMDLTATVLALAGMTPDPRWPMDGVDLMPYLTGNAGGDPHPMLFWEHGGQWAIRKGDWKLTCALDARDATTPTLGLYDLNHDIGEQHDLSGTHPERVSELKAAWNAWRDDLKGGK